MEKRIALLRNGIVFNIIIGPSVEEMATLFDCDAIEVTEQTQQAHIGYPFVNGVFEQAPYIPPVEEEILIEEVLVEEENF